MMVDHLIFFALSIDGSAVWRRVMIPTTLLLSKVSDELDVNYPSLTTVASLP
jgi:hypothetical protein